MADQVRSELRADKTGALPVDVALEQLHTFASVAFHLLPLPVGSGGNAGVKRKANEHDDARCTTKTATQAVTEEAAEESAG